MIKHLMLLFPRLTFPWSLFSAIHLYLNAVTLLQRKPLARAFRSKLGKLYDWFKVQRIAHFYSSSLFFYYDNSAEIVSSTANIK